ncbi:YdaU family protein [Comamonas kerstersii]|nr:YdaU family protein [Comamonas kerstersii]
MNHYPHHIGDFNSATIHLTFVERALYRELLDLYYDTERPLNSDVKKLARRVRAVTDEQRAALDIVLEEFFTLCEDGWHNERCDAEIAAYHQKQEQQRKAGQASAKARGAKKGASANGGGSDEGGLTGVERALNGRSTDVQPTRTRTRTRNTRALAREYGVSVRWVQRLLGG